MLNDHSCGYSQNCCYAKQLSIALLNVSHPPTGVQTHGGEDTPYIYYFLDTLSSGPNYKSLFGPPTPGCTVT